jgi:hypothetical protein
MRLENSVYITKTSVRFWKIREWKFINIYVIIITEQLLYRNF